MFLSLHKGREQASVSSFVAVTNMDLPHFLSQKNKNDKCFNQVHFNRIKGGWWRMMGKKCFESA